MCVTSPPHWSLAHYGIDGQIVLENSVEEYINAIVLVFKEVIRVIKSTGTLWLNLGDSYVGTGGTRKQAVANELFQMK